MGLRVVQTFLSCYWTKVDAATAFYLMPSRAWELLAGAWLAFLIVENGQYRIPRWAAESMSIAGVALITLSGALLSGQNSFPGPAAALPVVGAVLLLMSNSSPTACWISRVLGSGLLAYIGRISYPLYLWHWPVLVIMRSRRLYEISIWQDLIGLVVAVGLAAMTYEFVEKRAWQRARRHSTKRIVLTGAIGSGLLVCMALSVGAWTRFGWGYSDVEARLDASRKDMPQLDCMFGDAFPSGPHFDHCFPQVSGKAAVLLLGDSHANHWRPAVARAAEELDITAATLTMNGCRPLPGPVGTAACADFNQRVLANLPAWAAGRGLTGLVISARWPEGTGTQATSIHDRASWKPGQFFDSRARTQAAALGYLEADLRSVFRQASENGIRVLLVMPSPVQHYAAAHCLSVMIEARCNVTEQELKPYVGPAEEVIRRVSSEFESVRLIEPRKFMCIDGTCPVVMEGTVVYTDDDHISRSFSVRNSGQFAEGLIWLTGKSVAKRGFTNHAGG